MEIIHLQKTDLKSAARHASDVMKKGGIVVYPTDTIYGLGVDAANIDALNRLRALKGRETKKPVSLLVPDLRRMEECGTLNDAAKAFATKYLPGAVTMVIPAKKNLPEHLVHNGGVGVRIPNDPFCLTLAEAFGHPFTTTSANQSNMTPPKTIDELIWHFGPKISEVALIIDDGPRASKAASTVVSFMSETPHILREGLVPREDLGL
jgi:L-threonylcarbamoyladenylate synthase